MTKLTIITSAITLGAALILSVAQAKVPGITTGEQLQAEA